MSTHDNGAIETPDWVPDTCRCPGICHTCVGKPAPKPVALSIWDSTVSPLGEN